MKRIQQDHQKLSELRDPMLMNGQLTLDEANEYVDSGVLVIAAEKGGEYGA